LIRSFWQKKKACEYHDVAAQIDEHSQNQTIPCCLTLRSPNRSTNIEFIPNDQEDETEEIEEEEEQAE
jgi:hypothetical protein